MAYKVEFSILLKITTTSYPNPSHPQFVAIFALVSCVSAGVLAPAATYVSHGAAPLAYAAQPLAYSAQPALAYAGQPIIHKQAEEYDHHPQYNFAYDIQDGLTGDFKNQHESRDGDVVKGQYSLLEADGTRRVVDYTADPVNGFNAVVSREGAPKAAPALIKTVAAAPIAYHTQPALLKTISAPLAYAQPAYHH